MKIHLIDYTEDGKVPPWDENKQAGYTVCKCGYQRKQATIKEDEVTCRKCLRLIETEWKNKINAKVKEMVSLEGLTNER